jgi:hypothetical protein
VRVRTYGFPGCFTRPPGTSTRHHPHEPTTSKPIVPGNVLVLLVSILAGPTHPRMDLQTKATRTEPLEEPHLRFQPGGLLLWGAARPHTSVASLFAAQFRVWIQVNQGPRAMQ